MGNNLSATGSQIAMAFSTQSWGAIIAPVFIGLIADRYFNAERILGVLHLLGFGLLYLMSETKNFSVFYPYVFGYMILYMPTLALVNSVSFNQMKDTAAEFPVDSNFLVPLAGSFQVSLSVMFLVGMHKIQLLKGHYPTLFKMVAIASPFARRFLL